MRREEDGGQGEVEIMDSVSVCACVRVWLKGRAKSVCEKSKSEGSVFVSS